MLAPELSLEENNIILVGNEEEETDEAIAFNALASEELSDEDVELAMASSVQADTVVRAVSDAIMVSANEAITSRTEDPLPNKNTLREVIIGGQEQKIKNVKVLHPHSKATVDIYNEGKKVG